MAHETYPHVYCPTMADKLSATIVEGDEPIPFGEPVMVVDRIESRAHGILIATSLLIIDASNRMQAVQPASVRRRFVTHY